MFMIMLISFAQFGNLLFGTEIKDFSTVWNTIFTLFRIILGDFDFYALQRAHLFFGTAYFFLYVFLIFFVLLNMFLAIINDTYSEVKGDETLQENDFEGYEKMMDKLNFKKDKLTDIQLTLAGADANGDNHLEFSEWRNDLKKKGYGDTEIEAMFAKYDTDGDRILDPEEQRHLAEDLLKQKDSLNQEYAKMAQDAKDGETPAALADLLNSDDESGDTRGIVDDGVPYEEYAVLARRVDRMEHSIGSIVSKIDAVLIKLDTMEKAKTRRRETMSKLLDTIIEGGGDELTDEDRKNQMENLVADELARWDEEAMNSSSSDLGTSSGRPMSGMSMLRSPTSSSKGRDMV
ncbi:PKD2 [Bugula neritina]|uniref:PKD2 n=1 Tax=Bugula neritina TaxID=10212 RepID=A0A7J7K4M3_BUGNE|nr:PKD2 [Bugula neritina]